MTVRGGGAPARGESRRPTVTLALKPPRQRPTLHSPPPPPHRPISQRPSRPAKLPTISGTQAMREIDWNLPLGRAVGTVRNRSHAIRRRRAGLAGNKTREWTGG